MSVFWNFVGVRGINGSVPYSRSQWLPPLELLLNQIDRRFGDMFAKLDCAGEIKLDKAGAEVRTFFSFLLRRVIKL